MRSRFRPESPGVSNASESNAAESAMIESNAAEHQQCMPAGGTRARFGGGAGDPRLRISSASNLRRRVPRSKVMLSANSPDYE